jgi:hypothetical protein
VIAEAPIALTGPAGPPGLKEPIPASSPCPQEPVLDNHPTHEPNDSLQLDGIGGDIGEGSRGGQINRDDAYGVSDGEQEAWNIGEGSWGWHTDEDVYGVLDGEQEARRLGTG